MIRTNLRVAHKLHECGSCQRWIREYERYLNSWMSPHHDDIGFGRWVNVKECEDCAIRYGRGHLLVTGGGS